jgi:hypothetical protein
MCHMPAASAIYKQDRQCTYNMTLWCAHIIYLLGYPNCLIPYHSKRALLWWFNVAGNKTCLGLNVKCPIFLSDDQICSFMTNFHRSLECEISRQYVKQKPHWYMCVCVDRWMDGWYDESDRHFSGQKKLKLILSNETQNQPKNQWLQKKHKIKVIISQQIL